MSAMPTTLDLGAALQSFVRLLWLGHGVLIVLVVATMQLSAESPVRARSVGLPASDNRIEIYHDGIVAATANRTGPSTDVRPRGYIVCTQREAREARSDTPRWTSAYIALVGASPAEYIAQLRAMGASGAIELYDYECDR
jgi:hypothetical protein